jgi:class 3 adenylate cyclase
MHKPPPAKFSPELVMLMRSALNTAVDRIDRSHRTPATKAKMAQIRKLVADVEGHSRLMGADEVGTIHRICFQHFHRMTTQFSDQRPTGDESADSLAIQPATLARRH